MSRTTVPLKSTTVCMKINKNKFSSKWVYARSFQHYARPCATADQHFWLSCNQCWFLSLFYWPKFIYIKKKFLSAMVSQPLLLANNTSIQQPYSIIKPLCWRFQKSTKRFNESRSINHTKLQSPNFKRKWNNIEQFCWWRIEVNG